jgi:hypothetical protein
MPRIVYIELMVGEEETWTEREQYARWLQECYDAPGSPTGNFQVTHIREVSEAEATDWWEDTWNR